MSEHAQESGTVIYDQLLTEFTEWVQHHDVSQAEFVEWVQRYDASQAPADPLVASTDDQSATQSSDEPPAPPG